MVSCTKMKSEGGEVYEWKEYGYLRIATSEELNKTVVSRTKLVGGRVLRQQAFV